MMQLLSAPAHLEMDGRDRRSLLHLATERGKMLSEIHDERQRGSRFLRWGSYLVSKLWLLIAAAIVPAIFTPIGDSISRAIKALFGVKP